MVRFDESEAGALAGDQLTDVLEHGFRDVFRRTCPEDVLIDLVQDLQPLIVALHVLFGPLALGKVTDNP